MDPWGSDIAEKAVISPKFEDDFTPAPESDKLSDSAEYLAILGIYRLITITIT